MKKDFQKSAQTAVRDSSADWNTYKKWCEDNGKRACDARVFLHYCEDVLGIRGKTGKSADVIIIDDLV